MSAMHLHAAHIAAIVGTLCTGRDAEWSRLNPIFCAKILAETNADSINARYPDHDDKAEPVEVTAAMIDKFTCAPLSMVEVLKALSSYEYQSCEHDGWATSAARGLVDQLRSIAIGRLPGWEEAKTWAIAEFPAHGMVTLSSLCKVRR